jgi:hypothetical protein
MSHLLELQANPLTLLLRKHTGEPGHLIGKEAANGSTEEMTGLYGRDHVVSRQRPPDPLQLELTHWFDLHGVLNFGQHSRADEDLPRLRLVAQP